MKRGSGSHKLHNVTQGADQFNTNRLRKWNLIQQGKYLPMSPLDNLRDMVVKKMSKKKKGVPMKEIKQ